MFLTPSASLLPSGQSAPDFHLLDQYGRSLSLEDGLGAHGIILLFFSSSWLPGDLSLLNAYMEAYAELQTAGLGVMAISGMNWESLHHLANRLQSPYPILFDPCCRVSKFYKALLIPKFVTGRAIYGINPQKRIGLACKQASPKQIIQSLESGKFS